MQKIKYKIDNFEKHMKKDMNCTKDCEEYEKPSVMLQGTSGIRPGGGHVAKCRKLSHLVIMIW